MSMHFEEALIGNTELSKDALTGERYIAMNRFKVRDGAGPKFEKRWADRTSRLASLPGFRFFTLLRRVEDFNVNYEDDGKFGNYVSITLWNDKDAFDAWRTGDAFKEAHGGGGITDFIKLLTTAIFILDGGPKPAFYDGLLPVQGQTLDVEAPGGWRKVESDGQSFINPDVYVVMNRFNIAPGQESSFEKIWTDRESSLKKYDGFVFFNMMRRDASKADDGYNYMSMTIWKNKEAFEVWKKDQGSSHGQSSSESSDKPKIDMKKVIGKPPRPVFYEGKLALMSAEGA
eukprot:CAMPEP_0182428012 /NCGR_PEP_ID=MMETSP1167-20130531/20954_1 /TAXON_ID=2988 /ORGANISM="Mallomonas Sp, Strain CCMP3275" /LENGTH=286 /DNA_ID=CAMNT_0024610637 /DNA_START=214 /DNA_END=1074 /DNA_ORIENTATION=+